MDFEQALCEELSIITGITVWPLNPPEGQSAPYMTYETGDRAEIKTHDGFGDSGPLECTVDIYAITYPEIKTFSASVEGKIKTFMHRSIGTGGPYIQNVTFEDLFPEMYEPNVDLYRKSITFTVFY